MVATSSSVCIKYSMLPTISHDHLLNISITIEFLKVPDIFNNKRIYSHMTAVWSKLKNL